MVVLVMHALREPQFSATLARLEIRTGAGAIEAAARGRTAGEQIPIGTAEALWLRPDRKEGRALTYVTCPNCDVTLESATMIGPPSTCPDCCARMVPGAALAAPTRRHQLGTARAFDAALDTSAATPGAARQAFRSFASPFGERLATTGALLTSELVNNAVLHGPSAGKPAVGLHFETVGDTLQVEVSDEGDGFAAVARHDAQDAGSGWGLHIVEAMAESWGVDHGRPTRVWFELPLG